MKQPQTSNPYEMAIIRNADWFTNRQSREGYIDAEGDEFYGLRGDATLIGHSVTVRCFAGALTGSEAYFQSARRALDWLAARQDAHGGWKNNSAFTLDGAQCVFEGFNTYQNLTQDRHYHDVLVKAADRMIAGTLGPQGELRLPNIIEIGEYAHFALLAWKTTHEARFKRAGEQIIGHILRNFDSAEGFWLPFDAASLRHDLPARLIRPWLRWSTEHLHLRGRIIARLSDHLLPFAVAETYPQYAMSLMDAEALIDTLDGSCSLPQLKQQTQAAIAWAEANCAGPFPGSLVESCDTGGRAGVYPMAILNDTQTAALWPTACLLIAYCGMHDKAFCAPARRVADWILTMQEKTGGFSNFRAPDGRTRPLQSGNVNYYASMALWLFNEVYNNGRIQLFTRPK